MGAMHMHASGAMSMWTRMPGQTWPGFAASLLGMWMTMMVPMMIPPFAVMLWRFRRAAAGTPSTRLGGQSALVAVGYFSVWSLIGLVLLPLIIWPLPASTTQAAWRYGVRLGLDCARSCGPLMVLSLFIGGMDFRVMAAVTLAVTAKRLWECAGAGRAV